MAKITKLGKLDMWDWNPVLSDSKNFAVESMIFF